MYKPFFCMCVCMCVKFIYILSIYKQVNRELHIYTTERKCMLRETTIDFFLYLDTMHQTLGQSVLTLKREKTCKQSHRSVQKHVKSHILSEQLMGF